MKKLLVTLSVILFASIGSATNDAARVTSVCREHSLWLVNQGADVDTDLNKLLIFKYDMTDEPELCQEQSALYNKMLELSGKEFLIGYLRENEKVFYVVNKSTTIDNIIMENSNVKKVEPLFRMVDHSATVNFPLSINNIGFLETIKHRVSNNLEDYKVQNFNTILNKYFK